MIVGVLLLLIGACDAPSKDEVVRLRSPNGKADAVLIETNNGATTSFGYEVHVVEADAKPDASPAVYLYGATRNETAYGLNLRWQQDGVLGIEYQDANSIQSNITSISVGDERIHLVLRSNVTDPTAPSGGILYNLEVSGK